MAAKIDLEARIYLILSHGKGYTHGELATILNKDRGNLSKKLRELREERRTIYRTSHEENSRRPHYIKDDPEVFRQILKKLSKRLESPLLGRDPRRTYSISDDFGDSFVSFSVRLCQLIDKFIKSEYTLKIIKNYGFEPTYLIFKEETHGFCDIWTYVELAEDLKKRRIMSEKDLGEVFLADLKKKKVSTDKAFENTSPYLEFEIYSEEFYEEYPYLRR